jgi:hypothetical protein
MKALRIVVLVIAVLWTSGGVQAQMPPPPISGFVTSAQQGPVVGVTVSLVHPVIGRSSPSFTGPNGGYYFTNVPARPEPFYIEAYWGDRLLFRGQVTYQGWPVPYNIVLP